MTKPYAYFPGCSLHATSRAYDESIRAIAAVAEIDLEEVDDWNCCGATAYMNVNEAFSHCLTARNLALAEKQSDQIVSPCSACYTNLRKTHRYLDEYSEFREQIDVALAEADLKYEGDLRVRHFLEVIVEDLGLDRIAELSTRPLEGLKVAPYYGCQIVRPLGIDDDPDRPMMLDYLLTALGATPVEFPMKTVCCGGSLMGTQEDVALRLCRNLLLCAQHHGADVIAVTCPLCQINLDAYQGRINSRYDANFRFPVLYFTQLMGIAFGVSAEALGLSRGIVRLGKPLRQSLEIQP